MDRFLGRPRQPLAYVHRLKAPHLPQLGRRVVADPLADQLPVERDLDRIARVELAGDPDDAVAELRALAEKTGLALKPAIDLIENRTGFLAAHGIDVSRIRFATAFGRGVDYYTGFVFEIHDGAARVSGPLVGGGRYDALLSRLGAKEPIPAVGFAVWIDRLQAIGGGA